MFVPHSACGGKRVWRAAGLGNRLRPGSGCGAKRRNTAVERHDNPSDDVCQQNQSAAEENAEDDEEPNQRHVHVEIVGKTGAYPRDFLPVHHASQAPRVNIPGSTLPAGLRPDRCLLTALPAELILGSNLNPTVSAIHCHLLLSKGYDAGQGKVPRIRPDDELIKSNGDDYTQEPPPFPAGNGSRVRRDGAIR